MIIEGIVTTTGTNLDPNIAPMGPRFFGPADQFELRPFETSTTYANLKSHGEGVFHITDDVMLIARSAINELESSPTMHSAVAVSGYVIENCCRWHEFKAIEKQTNDDRKSFHCQIVHSSRNRDMSGFNRAKHAVLEATILATRVDFLPLDEIKSEYAKFDTLIQKTGSLLERQAFKLLQDFISKPKMEA